MIDIPKSKFTFELAPPVWLQIADILNRAAERSEPLDTVDFSEGQLATFEEATAVMLCMHIEGVGRLWITVHHACSPDESVAKRPWQEGFQPTPWTCPRCTKVARWSEDLTYEMELEMLQPVRFI